MEDILPQEGTIYKSANCVAGHGWAGLKKNKVLGPRAVMGWMLRAMGGPDLKNLGPYHL